MSRGPKSIFGSLQEQAAQTKARVASVDSIEKNDDLHMFKLKHRMLSIQEQNDNADRFSVVSGLQDVNEWDVLNKYAVYQSYKQFENKEKARELAENKIKEELDRQTREFYERKQAFKEE